MQVSRYLRICIVGVNIKGLLKGEEVIRFIIISPISENICTFAIRDEWETYIFSFGCR